METIKSYYGKNPMGNKAPLVVILMKRIGFDIHSRINFRAFQRDMYIYSYPVSGASIPVFHKQYTV